ELGKREARALGIGAIAVEADETVELETADAIVRLTRAVDTPIAADFLQHIAAGSRATESIEIPRRAADRIAEIANPRIEVGVEPATIRTAVDRGAGQAVREFRGVEVVVLRHVRIDHQLVQ